MHSKVISAALDGINGYIVEVESDLSAGLPSISIVGLPDTAVKESRERVTSAIRNSNFDLPIRKIVINLAPADIRKEGPGFDLPIAIGILAASEFIKLENLNSYVIIGELSLDGATRAVHGILPICLCVKKHNYKGIILPKQNSKEAAISGVNVYPVENLSEAVKFLNGEIYIEPVKSNMDDLLSENRNYDIDFSDIKGQAYAKRALEIASAGGHNVLMVGPPGAGKTMLAKRLPTILPALTLEEAIETTIIYSSAGMLPPDKPIIATRPFRSPHHTISDVALIGGGAIPRPGEISLSNNGVLFLDELPEFHRDVLEALREPLENSQITISRANATSTFPADFILVGAANPCPCGYYGHPEKNCICTPYHIRKYFSKISGPLLDRIDIHIEISPLKAEELIKESPSEPSSKIRERVESARKIQYERFKSVSSKIRCNAKMDSNLIKQFCKIPKEVEALLYNAIRRLGLSARAYDKILKIARTIADLENKENIEIQHITEAISYRSWDRILPQ